MPAPSSQLISRAAGLVLAASIAFGGVAYAEDGTSGITPDPVSTCELVPSTWNTNPTATPVASPVASPVLDMVATPVVDAAATPVADQQDALVTDLEASINGILGCMSTNDAENLTKITTPEFRGQWLGVGGSVNDSDFAAMLSLMPQLPYQLVKVESATSEGENATATIVFTVGRQKLTAEWTLHQTEVDGKTVWQVQSETLQPTEAPADATQLKVTISDSAYTFEPTTVAGTEIVINVSNTGENPHEVLIMRVPAEMTAGDIAAAPTGIPDGATFVAQATVPAGESGTVVLTNVRPGTYTVVDLLPDANGMPNISSGMIGTFEVTRP